MIADAAAPSPEGMPLPTWLKHKMIHGSLIVGMGPTRRTYRPLQARSHADRIRSDPQRDPRRPNRRLRDDLAATGKRIRHFQRLLTVHPTGGACLAQTLESGVVDSNGEVFGLDGSSSPTRPRCPVPWAARRR